MNCGIYKITNIKTGDFYIGQSKHLERRKQEHFHLLTINRHYNIYMQRSFNKHGTDIFSFQIILYCECFELTRYEQEIINKLHPKYNIYKGYVISRKSQTKLLKEQNEIEDARIKLKLIGLRLRILTSNSIEEYLQATSKKIAY